MKDLFKIIIPAQNDIFDGEVKPERRNQYENMFGKGSTEKYEKMGFHESKKYLAEMYLNRLFENCPIMDKYKGKIEIEIIDAPFEHTKAYSHSGNYFITLDSISMLYLWQMNKALLYGAHLSNQEQIELFTKLLLSYALIGNKTNVDDKKSYLPYLSKTPPHKSKEEFYQLWMMTEIQEQFMVAHEVAHILIQNEDYDKTSSILGEDYPAKYTYLFEKDSQIDEEILADGIAYDILLAIRGKDSKENVESIAKSIFLMIRYFLWLKTIKGENSNEKEWIVWMARNSAFRQKILASYHWGGDYFIIELLEYLESTLEVAALCAESLIKKQIMI